MDSWSELQIKNEVSYSRVEELYELWREKYDGMTPEEQQEPAGTDPELTAIYKDFMAASLAHSKIADEITRIITGEENGTF